MTLRDKLFGFRGRLRRRDWWLLGIALGLGHMALLYGRTVVTSAQPMGFLEVMESAPMEIRIPLWLLFLWPSLATSVKRFHDRGASGWPIFPYELLAFGMLFLPSEPNAWLGEINPALGMAAPVVASLLFPLVALVVLILLGFADGTPGPNRYGPSPRPAKAPPGPAKPLISGIFRRR